ncbi:MAG: CotH kinase family protein [Flavobacteriales bacterium]
MNYKTFLLLNLFISQALSAFSQLEGDAIFAEDQIVTIELDFPESTFWSTLTSNYEEATYTWANLTLTDTSGEQFFDSVGVRLKGNSSYNHPGNKKAFKIDFNKYVIGQDYDGLKKLNFSNGFKDPSVIREKVFFDISHAVGVPAPRTSFANVYMNGTFWGFYTVVEQIDDQFLDWAIEDDDGNLFKAGDNFDPGEGAADLEYYGDDQASYETRYELKTNEEENDWSDLVEFIDWINNSTDADFAAQIQDKIEFTEFLRSLALDNLFSNLDSYLGSARNYYIYHNAATDKWEWIKWDGNESFGSYTNGVNNVDNLALDYVNSSRPLIERIYDDNELYQQYLIQMCDITENYFNSAYMDNRIDQIVDLVQEAVYADTEKMYENSDFDTNIESDISGGGGPGGGGPGGGTTYGLKSFVSAKSSFVANNLDCTISVANGLEQGEFSVYPNPTDDFVYVSSSNSRIVSAQLLNALGQEVLDIEFHTANFLELDLKGLESGLYYLALQSESGLQSTQKVVIK